jgi:hypothetical protein
MHAAQAPPGGGTIPLISSLHSQSQPLSTQHSRSNAAVQFPKADVCSSPTMAEMSLRQSS